MDLQTIQPHTTRLSAAGIKKEYKSDIKVFNEWAGDRPVTPELIKAFFDDMKSKRANSTLGRYRAAIKASLLQSFGPGITLHQRAIIDTYFKEIKIGRVNNAAGEEKLLTRKELNQVIKLSGHKTALLIKTLFETAGRISEIVNIKLSDCQIIGDGVHVKIKGKGNKEGTVFLSLDTFNQVKAAYQGNIYLFEYQGQAISRHTAGKLLTAAGKKINRKLTPHMLRHTWATLSIEDLGLSKVSTYLRHQQTSTTADFYLHGKADSVEVLQINKSNIYAA